MENRTTKAETAEQLVRIARVLGQLEQCLEALAGAMGCEEDAEGCGEIRGFDELSRKIRNGDEITVGTQVTVPMLVGGQAETHWTVIGYDADIRRAVVQLTEITDYRAFSGADKEHPWGSNVYLGSEIDRWLNDEYTGRFRREDLAAIRDRVGADRPRTFWLLSQEEAGFGETDEAFEWYDGSLIDAEEARQLKDVDGDPAYWWLRTPNAGYAHNARTVNSAGTLSGNYARSATGVSPACYIE